MNAFEKKFYTLQRKLYPATYILRVDTLSFPDFMVFNENTVKFVEVKERKYFSLEHWKKTQPKQYDLFFRLPKAFLIVKLKENLYQLVYSGYQVEKDIKGWKFFNSLKETIRSIGRAS